MPIIVYIMSSAKYSYRINNKTDEAKIKFKNGWECQEWLKSQKINKVLVADLGWSLGPNAYQIIDMKVVDVK